MASGWTLEAADVDGNDRFVELCRQRVAETVAIEPRLEE